MGALPPHRLRYALAWDHDVCREVVAVAMRAILSFLRHRACEAGVVDPRGGGVVILQRFGGAVNLNVHLHAMVMDGCFAARNQGVVFHPLPHRDASDVADVLATIVPGVRRVVRRGLGDDADDGEPEDTWAETEPVLAGMAAASVQGRVTLGPRPGGRIRRRGDAPEEVDRPARRACHAHQDGFDLHAAVRIEEGCRDRLEAICRYALRPPVATHRLRWTADGQVFFELRHRWADGTTHLVFDPVELLERLAALIPRSRINLLLYYGVLGPHARWRALVVPRPDASRSSLDDSDEAVGRRRSSGALWAELMRRSFGFDVLACARCGRRMRLVALIDQPPVIRRILGHLRLPTAVPVRGGRRARGVVRLNPRHRYRSRRLTFVLEPR